jgi:hypothetical protein
MKYTDDILKKLHEVSNKPLAARINKSADEIKNAYDSTVSKMKSLGDLGDTEASELASAAISSAVKNEGSNMNEVGPEKVHTVKFDRCVADVKKNSPDVDPYAVCQASLGASAIKKSHRSKPEDDYVRTNEVKDIKSIEDIEASEEDYEDFLKTKTDMETNEQQSPRVNKKMALLSIKDSLEDYMDMFSKQMDDDELRRVADAIRSLVSVINLSESKIKITKGQLNMLIESNKFGAFAIGDKVLFGGEEVEIVDKKKGNKTKKPNIQSGIETGYNPCLYTLSNGMVVRGDKLRKTKTIQ